MDFDPTGAQDVHSSGDVGTTGAFITKMNADGSYAWTRSFQAADVNFAGIAAAANGAVVATGQFLWSIDLDPGPGVDMHNAGAMPNTGRQGFVVKLAADGSLVWGRNFVEGTTDGRSYSMGIGTAVDASDAVYVAGIFARGVDFDPGPGTVLRMGPYIQAAFLVKLTPAGDVSWAQTFDDGDYCPARLNGVTVATDGTVWAAGMVGVHPACEMQQSPGPILQPILVAYSAAGTTRGTWHMPPLDANAEASAVIAGASGSVYVGGSAIGRIDLDPGPGAAVRWAGPSPTFPNVYPSSFVVKLASDASLVWAQTLPGISLKALAVTSDAGALIAGRGATGAAVVAKLGPDGTSGWTFPIGGADTTADSVAARGNTFVVAGSNQISGSEDGAGDFDPSAGSQILTGNFRFVTRFNF